jgi:superfamily II DNA or RNA helicase
VSGKVPTAIGVPEGGSDRARGGLRGRTWTRFLRGPDPTVLGGLYVPALAEAVRYDRSCAYFSSAALSAAAQGFGKMIERLEALGEKAPRPAIRLVVNEELSEADAKALTETGDLSALEAHLKKRFKRPQDALEKARLAMLGWLVMRGLLEVRVGIMRRTGGIVHAKYGIITDPHGDSIVFRGSSNESAHGLVANYDQIEVSTSWDDPAAHRFFADEFTMLWQDTHPDVQTVTLPEALRLELVKLAPDEPPVVEPVVAMAQQRAAMLWRFIAETPYLPNGASACDATALVDPWPHQRHVVDEVATAWPEGRLLCDEVGLGKTVEAILVLRRLLAGRGVRRILILLPAGLLKQWQTELREKGGLVFPRLEGINTLVWPDDRIERLPGLAEALAQDYLLLSRETARTEGNLPIVLAAAPWDLVLLDESHAARRRKQEEGEFNSGTLLLTLLRELQLRRKARGIVLLSATPMQTHPWEPWDLLSVLGEGGEWLAEFAGVREYYAAIAALRRGGCDLETARRAARLVVADGRFNRPEGDASLNVADASAVAKSLMFGTSVHRQAYTRWLRRESPLARRMHRNTRETLRAYHARGLLAEPPPRRQVDDVVFDYQDQAEREVYNAVTGYIERRFEELEKEKAGKGFVMTIYRRRAASSPLALERSLERRRDGLRRVAGQLAFSPDLEPIEQVDPQDLDHLPDGDAFPKVSAAFPASPHVARAELADVERLLDDLRSLGSQDSKRDRFYEELRRATEDGRPILIFTEYADTMEYVRDGLVSAYGKSLGCFSGDGGQRWDGNGWVTVSKAAITKALQDGELRALVCTDAASEGLNLQAAGAVINYDLPWNPGKIEQRIGRIDRIGQRLPTVQVVNLFLRQSVDEQVYRVLRERCGLFEHFVGAMQPVLARARHFLLGQERGVPADVLGAVAEQIRQDPLADETYLESDADATVGTVPVISRSDLVDALRSVDGVAGIRVKAKSGEGCFVVTGLGKKHVRLSADVRVLESDRAVEPLTADGAAVLALAERLHRKGERLPLVIGTHRSGAFRAAVAIWIGGGGTEAIADIARLKQLFETWSGEFVDPATWLAANEAARAEAKRLVEEMEARASQTEANGLGAQVAAARSRLLKELGRYLACAGQGTDDLNGVFHRLMERETATRSRLMQAYERLGGYPTWEPDLCRELGDFASALSENQRKARLLGKELDAALQDPRWQAWAGE